MKIAGGDKNDGGRKWIEAEPTAAETSTKNSAAAAGYGRSGGGKATERTTPARRSRSGESVGRSCGLPYHIAANASPTPCLSQGAVPAPDPPPPSFPPPGEVCTTVIPAQAGIQVWGSPLGMLAISATLSPTGGVTQRSPDAAIYPRQGAPTRLWTQSITLAVPIRWRIWARGVRFGGQPVTERHRAGETCGAFPVESGDKNLRLRYDGMEWKCEKCGNINPPTRSVFCGKCGKRRDED